MATNPTKARNDAISSVAAALDSESLGGQFDIASLWAALPELRAATTMAADARRSLEVRPEGKNPRYFPVLHPAEGSVFVEAGNEDELADLLSNYADTEGYTLMLPMSSVGRLSCAHLRWPSPRPPDVTPGTVVIRDLHDIAERVDDRWFLRPLVGSEESAPHLLLRWWGLLLGLSSLARYHPAEWVAALNVNSSVLAVDLEYGLGIAEQRLPELIADALGNKGDPPVPVMRQRMRDKLNSLPSGDASHAEPT